MPSRFWSGLLCFWCCACKHGLLDNTLFINYKHKSFLNTFKYGTQLVKAFGFQPNRLKYAIFSFEFIKVWRLRHGLTRNMTSRLAIKFPTPYEEWSNSLPPGQGKASNARSMPGGMLKLRFDWYITFSILLTCQIL